MKRPLHAFAVAVFLISCVAPGAGLFAPHVALAQTNCSALEDEREGAIRDLNEGTRGAMMRMQQERSAMKTTDSSVADRRLAKAMRELTAARQMHGEDSPITKIAQDQVDFWQAKRSELALGTSVGGGQAYVDLVNQNIKKLAAKEADERARIAELERRIARCKGQSQPSGCASIAGTWRWWNGLTVTFSLGGGASYRGSASGTGSWQKTGTNSYHAHWNAGNTDDYFTLSRDGTKIEGTFDGKPGTSTRNC